VKCFPRAEFLAQQRNEITVELDGDQAPARAPTSRRQSAAPRTDLDYVSSARGATSRTMRATTPSSTRKFCPRLFFAMKKT
jgi:hypothetical protein